MTIITYTDGGCSGNPGPGAWAYIIVREGRRFEQSGFEAATTNNRMELTAVIESLVAVSKHGEWIEDSIEIHTDSQYVHNGINNWIDKWERNGWQTSQKKPVKNQDLWKRLKELTKPIDIVWHWVRGHHGNELNEACDRLVKKRIASS